MFCLVFNTWGGKKVLKRIKKAIDKFLDKLAENNEKSFGKGPLSCCELNRPKEKNKKQGT